MNCTKIHAGIITLIMASAFLAFQCCSPLIVNPPAPALDEDRIAGLMSAFSVQERAAKTLFFSGTLTLKYQNTDNALQILMIADATSGTDTDDRTDAGACLYKRMKIEITHPWGKPLAHIFIQGQQLQILDFTEKRFYRGSLKNKRLSQRIPVPLNCSILWSLARAFPALLKHQRTTSAAENRFALMDHMGNRVQHFEIYSSEPLPREVCFCKQNMTIFFSNFDDDDGILYARQVRFHDPDHKIDLEIDIDQMTFNKPLPNAVFSMEAPRDFTIVHLEKDDSEH